MVQKAKIGEFFRSVIDGGFDPLTVIEMMIAGTAYFADQYGVGRVQCAEMLQAVKLSDERSMIWTPTSG